MPRQEHAAPPDDAGHQGSHTVPSDVMVPSDGASGLESGSGAQAPRLHVDPQEPLAPPRRVHVGAVLGGIAAAVLLGLLLVFTFMTSAP